MIEYKFNRIMWTNTPTWVSYEVWEGVMAQGSDGEYFQHQTLLESDNDIQINVSNMAGLLTWFNKYLHDTWPDKQPIPEQAYV